MAWQDLQTILEGILQSPNAYYQPPPNLQIKYSCIVYRKNKIHAKRADNIGYHYADEYILTYISRTVDDAVIQKILALPMCTHDRRYTSDNLYHDVFTLYF